MLKFMRKISKITMSAATLWTFLWLPSLCNRLIIYTNAANYRSVNFTVTDAIYSDDDGSLVRYWLVGVVEGREERLIPSIKASTQINSAKDILNSFPKGTNLHAMYNPSMPNIFFQGESLRIRHDTGKFWENEVMNGSRLIKFGLTPLLPVIALNLFVRSVSRVERQEE
ncbi:MAG: hypothetical protein AB1589_04340 [Cyanobacteriota bacterium]